MRLPSSDDLRAINPEFAEFALHSELRFAGKTLRFPHGEVTTNWQPREWLSMKHADGGVHEPGMLAWMFALAETLGDRPVRFVDIGAAYGYFTLVASLAFTNARVVAVEPNSSLCSYIALACRASRLSNIRIENVLVTDRDGFGEFVIDNFRIRPATPGSPSASTTVWLETRELCSLLASDATGAPDSQIDLLKIDTEGWQARILPPAAEGLINRNSIVLLECDSPAKLAEFKRSNAEIAAPLFSAGYTGYWCDHRERGFVVEQVSCLDHRHERNGLLVLIPQSL